MGTLTHTHPHTHTHSHTHTHTHNLNHTTTRFHPQSRTVKKLTQHSEKLRARADTFSCIRLANCGPFTVCVTINSLTADVRGCTLIFRFFQVLTAPSILDLQPFAGFRGRGPSSFHGPSAV